MKASREEIAAKVAQELGGRYLPNESPLGIGYNKLWDALISAKVELAEREQRVKELSEALEEINHLATTELNGTVRQYYVTNRGDIAAISRKALLGARAVLSEGAR